MVFHGEELLVHRPTPKLENHPLSSVRDCLFNMFAATLHTGGRSSLRNLKTRHAVVTGTHKHCTFNLTNVFIIEFHTFSFSINCTVLHPLSILFSSLVWDTHNEETWAQRQYSLTPANLNYFILAAVHEVTEFQPPKDSMLNECITW